MDTRVLAIAALLAASTQAWAQAQAVTNDVFEWTVGGKNGGFALTWEGGDLRPGAQTADLSVVVGQLVEPVVQEWLRAALDGEQPARDVDLLELGPNRTVRRATRYPGSKVTAVVLPPMNMWDRMTYDDG
jgi:hypothetical protein